MKSLKKIPNMLHVKADMCAFGLRVKHKVLTLSAKSKTASNMLLNASTLDPAVTDDVSSI